MDVKTVLDNEYATLWHYPEKKIVHHKFHKFAFGQDFRNVLTKGMEIFEENGCNKWLSDDRGISALHPDDSDWSGENFRPQIGKAGLKYWALVMSKKQFVKASYKNSIEGMRKVGAEVKAFDDPEEAFTWLDSQ